MKIRTIITAAAACAAVAAVAPLAEAQPAPTVVSSVHGTCTVAKLTGLRGATKVRVRGSELTVSLLPATGCDTAYANVARAATEQMPFTLNGFACTPRMVSNRVGQWKCTFKAADTDAVVTETFTARYAK